MNIEKIKPSGIFTNYIYKAIPLAFDESMSYYETLCALLKRLKDDEQIINNNADLIVELENYINHYFDNLNVQEEINNKLDEMVEDGTLENIISQYIELSTTYVYDTVNDMVNATNLINGSYAKTQGFYSFNDGGGALYKIRTITNEDNPDEMSLISLNDETLVAELIKVNVNVKQYGAKGDDNHDDTINIQSCINENLIVSIPRGTYKTTDSINISSNYTVLKGENPYNTIIKKYGSDTYSDTIIYSLDSSFNYGDYPSIINLLFTQNNNINSVKIKDIGLISNTPNQNSGIIAPHISYSMFENIRFSGLLNGLICQGWINNINRCLFFSNTYGIKCIDNYNFITTNIKDSYFNQSICDIRNAQNCGIIDTQCDNGNPCFDIINSKSVTLTSCKTETYNMVLRNTNSNVYIYGGDYEGHSSVGATFGGFFINQTNGNTYINNAYVHFEDLASLGTPNTTHVIDNSGGYVKLYANINTPYTYTNYAGTNAINVINDNTYSTIKSIMNVINKVVTSGTKVEILRLPFSYGKNLQAKLTGYGTYSHTACILNTILTGVSITNPADISADDVVIEIDDNSLIASKDTDDITVSITAEQDTTNDELVIYFNSNAGYQYNLYCKIEFNILT